MAAASVAAAAVADGGNANGAAAAAAAAAAAGKEDELAGVGLAFYSQIYVLKVPIARLARLGNRSDQHDLSLLLPL